MNYILRVHIFLRVKTKLTQMIEFSTSHHSLTTIDFSCFFLKFLLTMSESMIIF